MINIEEITEYFNELFRLGGQKELVEKQNLLNIFIAQGSRGRVYLCPSGRG